MQTTMDVTSLPTPEMTKEQYRLRLIQNACSDPREWMDVLVSLDKRGWEATSGYLRLTEARIRGRIKRLEKALGYKVVVKMQITWMGRALLDRYNNLPD